MKQWTEGDLEVTMAAGKWCTVPEIPPKHGLYDFLIGKLLSRNPSDLFLDRVQIVDIKESQTYHVT